MYTGHHYPLTQTLRWSQRGIIYPFVWSVVATVLYQVLGWTFLGIPWLPMSLIGVAVAFYLGFKNNASYDRMWEARKIYGAIVNASRTWAFTSRDLVVGGAALDGDRAALVHRHVAWMDALRHQLRKLKSWEHDAPLFMRLRESSMVPEYTEDLRTVLAPNLAGAELDEVLAKLNPAAHLLSAQSRHLARRREAGHLDGFGYVHLQALLTELMAQQGKAERIKNFPFPRQYATVNRMFATIFAVLVPFGLLLEFSELGAWSVWLSIPFSTAVSWVFLTTDQIGEWSENPFEGLANDVPIASMSRGIERDIRQMAGETELPPAREERDGFQY